MKLNINTLVRLTLSDVGVKQHRDWYLKHWPKHMMQNLDIKSLSSQVQEMPLWQMCRIFGPVCSMTFNPPIQEIEVL